MSNLSRHLEQKQWNRMQEWFSAHDVLEIVDELYRLESNELAVAFRPLPKDTALAVFESMVRPPRDI